MPKRSRETETDEERKLRKIRKMEKKISKYKEALTAADPETLSIPEQDSVDENFNIKEDENTLNNRQEEHEDAENDPEVEEELPTDILSALGEGGDNDDSYGAEIKTEIVKIFKDILTDGLNKDLHENLQKTKIPGNVKLLDAPKLNLEFAGLLNHAMTTRDNLLKDRQQDLGKAISLVTRTINDLTKKDFNKLEAIKSLSDSTRLLSNLHHQYTQIRRKLIAPFMDKSLSQNLSEVKRSEFLYSKLEETVKTSSAMKRTINTLKPKTSKNFQNPRRQAASNLPRMTNQNYKQRTYPSNPAPAYKNHRTHHRPTTQHRATPRRPTTTHYRGGRAKYP